MNATVASAAPRIMLLPGVSCYNSQDTVPYVLFECLGLVVVHKPPSWEVSTEGLRCAYDLFMWL